MVGAGHEPRDDCDSCRWCCADRLDAARPAQLRQKRGRTLQGHWRPRCAAAGGRDRPGRGEEVAHDRPGLHFRPQHAAGDNIEVVEPLVTRPAGAGQALIPALENDMEARRESVGVALVSRIGGGRIRFNFRSRMTRLSASETDHPSIPTPALPFFPGSLQRRAGIHARQIDAARPPPAPETTSWGRVIRFARHQEAQFRRWTTPSPALCGSDALNLDLLFKVARLGKVKGQLHAKPCLGCRAECLRQPVRHFD